MLLEGVDGSRELLLDAATGRAVTAREIRARAEEIAAARRGLAFLLPDGTVESACWFLALLEARHPVALVDPTHPWSSVSRIIDRYVPELVIDPGGKYLEELEASARGTVGGVVEPSVWRTSEPGPQPHEDLAVLLSTSGSTGSPKFVRLSASNIRTNAEQIVQALGITREDRGVTALPLFYSFGMSVLTSHALAGSPVVVTSRGVLDEDFWADLIRHQVTFLPGVPMTFSMLKRLGFEQRELPRLRALIQAGGRLAPELVMFFHQVMAQKGGRFFVMYGQTEASPRMACLPSERLPEKLGSAGLALSGGHLSIRSGEDAVLEATSTGQVFYSGPNVMLGYAESRDDLALGATHGPELATGDLGYLDDEGFLFLTGRSKRICKLAGTRVSLDEIEGIAAELLGSNEVAAVDAGDEGVRVFAVVRESPTIVDLRRGLARRMGVPPKLVGLRAIDAIPLLSSGKTDYAALEATTGSGAPAR